MKVALTGASGFVGSALQNHFKEIVYLHRDDDEELILQKLEGVDVVINLAGAPIIKRWSDPYKKILLESRIRTTETLVRAVNKSQIKHFISTSAIGIYPDDKKCDESCTDVAGDFLGLLASKWESEALECEKPTTILYNLNNLGPIMYPISESYLLAISNGEPISTSASFKASDSPIPLLFFSSTMSITADLISP